MRINESVIFHLTLHVCSNIVNAKRGTRFTTFAISWAIRTIKLVQYNKVCRLFRKLWLFYCRIGFVMNNGLIWSPSSRGPLISSATSWALTWNKNPCKTGEWWSVECQRAHSSEHKLTCSKLHLNINKISCCSVSCAIYKNGNDFSSSLLDIAFPEGILSDIFWTGRALKSTARWRAV